MAELELCKEYVEGNSRPEAPLLLAKGNHPVHAISETHLLRSTHCLRN